MAYMCQHAIFTKKERKREKEEGRKECTYAHLVDNIYNTYVK